MEKKVSRSWLNEQATHTPNTAGVHGYCVGPGEAQKLNYLKVFKA